MGRADDVVDVFDDAEVGLIRVEQSIKGLPTHGVALGGLDWGRLPEGFGARGATVGTEAGLVDALETDPAAEPWCAHVIYATEPAFVRLDACEPGGELPPFDVQLPGDYAALAKAFGCCCGMTPSDIVF